MSTIRFQATQEETMMREAVRGIAGEFGPSYFIKCADDDVPTDELWDALASKGYLGVNIPEEWGGGGLGMTGLATVLEEISSVGCPLLLTVVSPAIAGNVLVKYGTDAQREEWLRPIAEGTKKLAFAITEPDAGSNSHNISTRATRVEGGWKLNGSKTFISGVEESDGILVVARTGTNEKSGRGLLSLFITDPEGPGLERQHIRTSIHAPENQWMLFFDDFFVPDDRMVGPENEGLKAIFEGLNPERIMGAAMCNGIARMALDKAAKYANERKVWGVPIGAHQGVSHPLAQAKIELECARLMMRHACELYDAGAPNAGEAANMAKFAAAEAGLHCLDQAMQTHGGNGITIEYELSPYWGIVRLLKTAPVSREMILNYIAEHSLGLPKSY